MTSLVVQSLDLARDENVSRTLTVCASVGVVLADDLARVESLSVYSVDVAVRDYEDPDNPARPIRLRADDVDAVIALLVWSRERLRALGLLDVKAQAARAEGVWPRRFEARSGGRP